MLRRSIAFFYLISALANTLLMVSLANAQNETCRDNSDKVGKCGGPWLRTIVGFVTQRVLA
jgi:hypothetical protein